MNKATRPSGRNGMAGNGADGGDLLPRLMGGPAVVRSPRELAGLLWAASPGQARRFALDAHERACERADDDFTAFWHETLHWLSCRMGGEPAAAAGQTSG